MRPSMKRGRFQPDEMSRGTPGHRAFKEIEDEERAYEDEYPRPGIEGMTWGEDEYPDETDEFELMGVDDPLERAAAAQSDASRGWWSSMRKPQNENRFGRPESTRLGRSIRRSLAHRMPEDDDYVPPPDKRKWEKEEGEDRRKERAKSRDAMETQLDFESLSRIIKTLVSEEMERLEPDDDFQEELAEPPEHFDALQALADAMGQQSGGRNWYEPGDERVAALYDELTSGEGYTDADITRLAREGHLQYMF